MNEPNPSTKAPASRRWAPVLREQGEGQQRRHPRTEGQRGRKNVGFTDPFSLSGYFNGVLEALVSNFL